jgi:hypothetical protein
MSTPRWKEGACDQEVRRYAGFGADCESVFIVVDEHPVTAASRTPPAAHTLRQLSALPFP